MSDDIFLSKKVQIERKQMMQRSVDISRNASKLPTPREIKGAMADTKQVAATLRKKSLAALEAVNNTLELKIGSVRMKHTQLDEKRADLSRDLRSLQDRYNTKTEGAKASAVELKNLEKKYQELFVETEGWKEGYNAAQADLEYTSAELKKLQPRTAPRTRRLWNYPRS